MMVGRSFLSACALALLCRDVAAADRADTSVERSPSFGRETGISVGYSGIIPPRGFVSYANADTSESPSIIAGTSLDVTRRFHPLFEYGFFGWLTGGSSDGKGSYAHLLSRFGGQFRFLPLGVGRVEPWIGVELELALADDFVRWDPTSTSDLHAVSLARVGHAEGLGAGARARLGEMIAVGARGGILLLGFAKAHPTEQEPGDTTGDYFIRPNDYRTRLWYSVTFSLELTVPDS
jgi:hypothetical protein